MWWLGRFSQKVTRKTSNSPLAVFKCFNWVVSLSEVPWLVMFGKPASALVFSIFFSRLALLLGFFTGTIVFKEKQDLTATSRIYRVNYKSTFWGISCLSNSFIVRFDSCLILFFSTVASICWQTGCSTSFLLRSLQQQIAVELHF